MLGKGSVFIILALAVAYQLTSKYFNKSSLGELLVTDDLKDEYDYVIVGGGSAGSVIAARLAEDVNNRVLLLEAGNHFDKDQNIHILGYAPSFVPTNFEWQFKSETEDGIFLGLKDRKTILNKGKVLGGSSSINNCVYVRGSPFDFNEWVTKYGCVGWGYDDLLPYFKKAEDIKVSNLMTSEYHGIGGPIAVSDILQTPVWKYFASAGKELGYPETDYNGAFQTGFGRIQSTQRNGVRSSTGLEYLGKRGKKSNLDVSVNSYVTKVKIDKNIASGVFFIKNMRKQYIKAKREVILSAGAISSPQLLMLSGVGPKKHLHDLHIPLIKDLPVAQRLDDHVAILLNAKINQSISLVRESFSGLWPKIEYALFGSGVLSLSPVEGTAFMHFDKSKVDKKRPDIQLLLAPFPYTDNYYLNYNKTIAAELLDRYQSSYGMALIVVLLHPKSTGILRLKSNDPFDSPKLDTNILNDKQDVDGLLAGIRIAEELISTRAMQELGADISVNEGSFCSQHKLRSDDFWRCMIHHVAFSFYHSTSTCKMGRHDDITSVVDPDLRVKGIGKLRVCDASVFPEVTSGNTNAPVIAVAEKFADMLKKEHF